jgi:HK97 family phage major capsid protein
MEVRETTAQTDNTAIVGAFGTAAQVFRRSGITVTVSTEHSTYFVENKVAILAEERLALAVYRPNAFATVTGI